MKGLKIAVIGGGSSYTPELIDGFIKRSKELKVSEIYLVDIEEGKEKLEIVGSLAKRMILKAGLDTEVILSLDRRSAIKNADFVLTQFRVGGLKAREKDELIPLKYNCLGQETTGAGGFAKALRTIPVIMDICKDIEELAPNAWLINFTNPAGLVTEAVLRYTNIKAIGLCNVPITMKKTTAKMLDVDENRLKIEIIGLNHLSWARKVYLDGDDITEKVIEMNLNSDELNMKNISNLGWNDIQIRNLKMIPSPYLRYYYMTDKMVMNEKRDIENGSGSRAQKVIEIEKELFNLYKDEKLDIKPIQLEQRGGAYYSDAAVSLISSIYNNKKDIHTVNIKNNGAITNLDNDVVIECDAIVDSTGARPITQGRLENEILGLVSIVKSYEILTAEAAITGDYGKALVALSTNPLVPSIDVAENILNDILRENEKYLPQFKEWRNEKSNF